MQPMLTSQALAKSIASNALKMVSAASTSHIGGALSVKDILAVLYARVMKYHAQDPQWEERDRLLFSKGHSCSALYAALSAVGFFPAHALSTFAKDGSVLTAHTNHEVPGVELSTGSLGHALPVACGLATAAKQKRAEWRVFTILSDGELDEGSNWEAILFAAHHQLDNLTAIVDFNKIQSFGSTAQVLNLEPLAQKFQSFGWESIELDGHDHQALEQALSAAAKRSSKPHVLIAHTVKGKGVSFMQDELAWHYKSPTAEQLAAALREIAEG